MTATALQDAPYYAAAVLATAGAGVWLAWWLRRHTMISARNLYLAALVAVALDVLIISVHAWVALLVTVPLTSLTVAGSAVGRRWRLSDLGAGEELRAHEQARRWLWQPPVARAEVSACTSSRRARSSANAPGPPVSPTSR
jgi:hypothetical protein